MYDRNIVLLQTFQPMTAQLSNVHCHAVERCKVSRRTKISIAPSYSCGVPESRKETPNGLSLNLF